MKNKFFTIFTLGLLSAIGPFSIDMYLPGFPEIAESLNTTVAHIGLSLSSFFIGISVGQLIYGPLLDRYGRKIPMYIGLTVYLLTSIYCAFVTDADTLIIARFVQAIGSCAGMVAARALVRDLFPVSENAKIFSLLMLVIAISPIIAPTAGGFITAHLGWPYIFIMLAVISLLTLLAVIFGLPSGNAPDREVSLKPSAQIRNFAFVARVPQFYTYAFAGAIASSGLYSYIAGSPVVFMKIYEVTEKQYGWIFAFISLGLLLASQFNTFLLRKYSSEKITLAALGTQVFLGFLFLIVSLFGLLDLYSTIGFIWLYLATQGFVFPNTSALALAPFSRQAGTASALMGAVQLGVGALATAVVSSLSKMSVIPMTAAMCVCACSAFLVLIIGKRNIDSNPV